MPAGGQGAWHDRRTAGPVAGAAGAGSATPGPAGTAHEGGHAAASWLDGIRWLDGFRWLDGIRWLDLVRGAVASSAADRAGGRRLACPAPPVILNDELVEGGVRPHQQIEDRAQLRLRSLRLGQLLHVNLIMPLLIRRMLLVVPAEVIEQQPAAWAQQPFGDYDGNAVGAPVLRAIQKDEIILRPHQAVRVHA